MILVLGIDAATWTMIDPNIDRLPAFKQLCETGRRDTIHLKEKPLSPSIWYAPKGASMRMLWPDFPCNGLRPASTKEAELQQIIWFAPLIRAQPCSRLVRRHQGRPQFALICRTSSEFNLISAPMASSIPLRWRLSPMRFRSEAPAKSNRPPAWSHSLTMPVSKAVKPFAGPTMTRSRKLSM